MLWRQVIDVFMAGSEAFDWHTLSNSGNSLRRPLGQHLKNMKKCGSTGSSKLGKGRRLAFCSDLWGGNFPLNIQYSKLFRIALLPNGSVAAH